MNDNDFVYHIQTIFINTNMVNWNSRLMGEYRNQSLNIVFKERV